MTKQLYRSSISAAGPSRASRRAGTLRNFRAGIHTSAVPTCSNPNHE